LAGGGERRHRSEYTFCAGGGRGIWRGSRKRERTRRERNASVK
jgi:hypothetical protein